MGVQLAGALDAAHRKGGFCIATSGRRNIFIIKSGQAKLLDFGLAKLEGAAASDESGGIDAGKTQGVEKRDRFHSVCKKVPKVR